MEHWIDDQIASLRRGISSKHETQEARTDLVAVPAVVSLARTRFRAAVVVATSAAVITLITAFTFVGSPPAGPKPKNERATRPHCTRGTRPVCPQPRLPKVTDSQYRGLTMLTTVLTEN